MTESSINSPPSPESPKILVCITEDWFALSHFVPLLETLGELSNDVLLLTNISGRREELEALGVGLRQFDYHRSSTGVRQELASIRALTKIFREERPDIVHLIALKPLFLGGLAARRAKVPRTVLHLTGTGSMGISRSARHRMTANAVMRVIARLASRSESWLMVENDHDARALARQGANFGDRCTIVSGAGVDPYHYTELPLPETDPPKAGFVGRMQKSKGVDRLVEAQEILHNRGVELELMLCGMPDADIPTAFSQEVLDKWASTPGIEWAGHVEDVRKIWRNCHFAVIPSRGGEGMPRAMLEAAACGRALIVTDVPGCSHFVRDGVEGLVVAPDAPEELAAAMQKLAGDSGLCARMGKAARQRLLGGYTAGHVTAAIRDTYQRLLDQRPAAGGPG